MAKLVICGAGGHAKVVIDIAQLLGHEVVAIFDDNVTRHQQLCAGIPIIGSANQLLPFAQAQQVSYFFVAVGHNQTRLTLAQQWTNAGLTAISLIHPQAVVAQNVTIGSGVVIMAGACINADAVINDQVIINTNAVVDHDCYLAEAVHIAPAVALCGGVKVGKHSLIGVGANVIPCIQIGEAVIIGAGAVVVSDITSYVTAVGIPAKPLSR